MPLPIKNAINFSAATTSNNIDFAIGSRNLNLPSANLGGASHLNFSGPGSLNLHPSTGSNSVLSAHVGGVSTSVSNAFSSHVDFSRFTQTNTAGIKSPFTTNQGPVFAVVNSNQSWQGNPGNQVTTTANTANKTNLTQLANFSLAGEGSKLFDTTLGTPGHRSTSNGSGKATTELATLNRGLNLAQEMTHLPFRAPDNGLTRSVEFFTQGFLHPVVDLANRLDVKSNPDPLNSLANNRPNPDALAEKISVIPATISNFLDPKTRDNPLNYGSNPEGAREFLTAIWRPETMFAVGAMISPLDPLNKLPFPGGAKIPNDGIPLSRGSHLQQNSRNVLVRFGPGAQFNVTGDATTVIKRPRSVQTLTDPPIFLSRDVKIDLVDRFVEVNRHLRDKVPNGGVITELSSPRPGMLSQARISNKTFDDLSPGARETATRQMNDLVNEANHAVGARLHEAVPSQRTPGYAVTIDDNPLNFRFNEHGEVTHWFDPAMVSVHSTDVALENRGIRFDIEDFGTQQQRRQDAFRQGLHIETRTAAFKAHHAPQVSQLLDDVRDVRRTLYRNGVDESLYDDVTMALLDTLRPGSFDRLHRIHADDILNIGSQLVRGGTSGKLRELANQLPADLQQTVRALANSIDGRAPLWANGPQF